VEPIVFLLKLAIIGALATALMFLARNLHRDFKEGVIHSHLGTFRRNDQPRAFWFWTSNYFILTLLVGAVVVGSLVALIS
jgi:hypothetical protein